jgi:predicted site-specific integrase-resolvase
MARKSETMTTEEVMAALGISRSTLQARIKSGAIKPLPKAPGLIRAAKHLFSRADIEAIVKANS